MMKEIHKNSRKPRRKSRHNIKIISIPTTPDLYEEDEREENGVNQSEISGDKNTKMELKVFDSETPETVRCPAENEDFEETEVVKRDENEDQHEVLNEEEDEKKVLEETKECNDAEEEEEDDDDDEAESENTESIQEDVSAGKSTDEDDEDGNTYTVDE
jgi:hypothetical protein